MRALAVGVLGALLHFGIAPAVMYAYYLASQRFPALVQRPWAYGSSME